MLLLSESNWRKPQPGMVLYGIKQFNLDPSHCTMIGDNIVDIQCAKAAGVNSILVKTGLGESFIDQLNEEPNYIANDLYDAVKNYVVSNELP